MVFQNRLVAVALLSSAGFLSACAIPSDGVITRASQVDAALSNQDGECHYSAISNTLAEQLEERDDADRVMRDLNDLCPDLEVAFLRDINRTAARAGTATLAGGSFSDPEGTEGAPSSGGGTSSTGGDSPGGDSGGSDSSGGDSGGGDSGGGDSSGGDSGGGDSGGGDSSGGDSGGGKGSKGNNGGGNGSEGSSPGRGRGANQDE